MGISEVQAGTIVNINSRINLGNPGNPVVLFLEAGTYDVQYIGTAEGGAYDAWNAWGNVFGCDSNGENCSRGWLNNYGISSSELGTLAFSTGRYATPALALANGQNTSFTLTADDNVSFFIGDSNFSDNVGGVSLQVSAVPEPLTILGAGTAIGFGASFKRKLAKNNQKKKHKSK